MRQFYANEVNGVHILPANGGDKSSKLYGHRNESDIVTGHVILAISTHLRIGKPTFDVSVGVGNLQVVKAKPMSTAFA